MRGGRRLVLVAAFATVLRVQLRLLNLFEEGSGSRTGEETLYSPEAHLPRSIRRQRPEQKGTSSLLRSTGFLQMGQRRGFADMIFYSMILATTS